MLKDTRRCKRTTAGRGPEILKVSLDTDKLALELASFALHPCVVATDPPPPPVGLEAAKGRKGREGQNDDQGTEYGPSLEISHTVDKSHPGRLPLLIPAAWAYRARLNIRAGTFNVAYLDISTSGQSPICKHQVPPPPPKDG